ncbi:MAG TPA: hypothetical protein VFK16_07810 [Gemmatimonadaceae bacterium]|jgi:hypothetical protein|nr:hypothetical protein [Gemmatimonadaceae bacterium]
MTRKTYQLVGALGIGMLMAACGGARESAKDTAMSSDLSMAGGAAATQPALGDTAAASKSASTEATKPAPKAAPKVEKPAPRTTKPAATTPKPTPKPPAEIASGTNIALHPSTNVCTDSNKVGQTVKATVATAVSGSNGAVIPAGAVVSLRITELKRSENSKDPITMSFEPYSVEIGGQAYALAAKVTDEKIEHIRNESKSSDAKKVVGGAVVGAIAGRLIGKSTKGAVVGAAAGAAAGAGAAAVTANHEGCIARGSAMTIQLTSPITLH